MEKVVYFSHGILTDVLDDLAELLGVLGGVLAWMLVDDLDEGGGRLAEVGVQLL